MNEYSVGEWMELWIYSVWTHGPMDRPTVWTKELWIYAMYCIAIDRNESRLGID